MTDDPQRQTRALWDQVATDWDLEVGESGDANRRLCSDPVLWRLAGDVGGKAVLDAGCGTGYLSRQLQTRGARVIGVDFSQRMIEIARQRVPEVDFRVDSCAELTTLDTDSVELLVSNYVLMDIPDLEGTVRAFHRVLRPGGRAVVVILHPCFPQAAAEVEAGSGELVYRWGFPYFERRQCTNPPWGRFTRPFTWFHRPLSDYWRAFRAAGLQVTTFEEPHLAADALHPAEDEAQLEKLRSRPYSVAFELQKS